MPSENPNLNSQRMQRAQRINNIEESRLLTQIHFIDKERKHRMRVTAQDMRMVQLTLEYIHASSGYSQEALPPDFVEPKTEQEREPCFMYGQRLKKWKKGRRAQSAPSSSQHRKRQEEAEKNASSNSLANGQRKGWGSAYFPMGSIREVSSDLESQTKPESKEQKDSIKVQTRFRPKTSLEKRSFLGFEVKADNQNSAKEDTDKSLEHSRKELAVVKLDDSSRAHSRKADIIQAANKVRVMATSARHMRNATPMQALMLAPPKTVQQRVAWESKISENTNRKQRLDAKLRMFMSNYPTRSVASNKA